VSEHCVCYSNGATCCHCGRSWDEDHPGLVFVTGLVSFIGLIFLLWTLLRVFGG
jgi:hypothetical protein